MSSSVVTQAADRRGPLSIASQTGPYPIQKIAFAGTGSSQNLDLQSNTYFNGAHYQDCYVTISVEGGTAFWWFWSNAPGDTVDKTAVGSGLTVGAYCQTGIMQDERPTGRYLVIQTNAAANVHIWISSGKF